MSGPPAQIASGGTLAGLSGGLEPFFSITFETANPNNKPRMKIPTNLTDMIKPQLSVTVEAL
jgi:hypothetical protein